MRLLLGLWLAVAVMSLFSQPSLGQYLFTEARSLLDDIGLAKPEDVLKLEPAVYQSLPAVYRVQIIGTAKLQFPVSIELDFDLLNQEYEKFRAEVGFPSEVPRAMVQWIQVAALPERYLRPSSKSVTLELKEGPLGSGSCYAIDRNGVLLTNRHVVQSAEDSPLDANSVLCHEPPALLQMLSQFELKMGTWAGKGEDSEFVQSKLLDWFGSLCKRTAQITKFEIEVAYTKKNLIGQSSHQLAASFVAEAIGMEVRQAILVPAHVVAVGDEGDEKDIAILQIDGNVRDALICLDLATPDKVKEMSRVYSLGFPGYRYDLVEKHSRDHSSVNVQAGQILSLPKGSDLPLSKRLKSNILFLGMDEKLMTVSTKIRCGSSGGPIILNDGSVAGMNVGYGHPSESEDATVLHGSQLTFKDAMTNFVTHSRNNINLAVPLPNILEFVKKHGIVPDPGPTTADWRSALVAYRQRDFATADRMLIQILKRQSHTPFAGISVTRIASHYVEELEALAIDQIER